MYGMKLRMNYNHENPPFCIHNINLWNNIYTISTKRYSSLTERALPIVVCRSNDIPNADDRNNVDKTKDESEWSIAWFNCVVVVVVVVVVPLFWKK